MRRDMNMVRDILLNVEAQEPGKNRVLQYNGEAREQAQPVLEEMARLIEAGFIKGKPVRSGDGKWAMMTTSGLTWSGADLLDSIRDNRVWEGTVEKMKEVGGSVSIETMKAIAAAVALRLLGM